MGGLTRPYGGPWHQMGAWAPLLRESLAAMAARLSLAKCKATDDEPMGNAELILSNSFGQINMDDVSSHIGEKHSWSVWRWLEAMLARSPMEAWGLGPPLSTYLLSPLLAP